MSIELVMPSNDLIHCRPLLLLPWIFPSIRLFSNQSALHIRWPKHWTFSFNMSPSSEHPGLISFRMDWLDLLAVQGTLKSLLQHHSSKASILRRSAFFTIQLSHPYMTTGKTLALTRQTFVGKVMSLIFNMLYLLVITFLPRVIVAAKMHMRKGGFIEEGPSESISTFLSTLPLAICCYWRLQEIPLPHLVKIYKIFNLCLSPFPLHSFSVLDPYFHCEINSA